MTPLASPRLLADIGGTCAHFTFESAPGVFQHTASLRCAEHSDFHTAVSAYLAGLPSKQIAGLKAPIEHAVIAIANPVEGDDVRMKQYHWQFSIEPMRQHMGLATLVVVTDVTALALAVSHLAPHQRRQVGVGLRGTAA